MISEHRYAVAVLSPITRQWAMVSQTFENLGEAQTYASRMPNYQTRLVPLQLAEGTGADPGSADERESRREPQHTAVLSETHHEFVRFLVREGRLSG
jgi:hypothetical protein